MNTSVGTDIAKEKMFALAKPKVAKQPSEAQKQVSIKQDPSSTSGVQWAYQPPAAAKESAQVDMDVKKNDRASSSKGTFKVITPGEEDLAILSSTVSMNDKSVPKPRGESVKFASRLGLNAANLEQTYRDKFKQSKSHNLLMERFMSMVKFQSIKTMCSLLGMSGEDQQRIQSEVRQEALAEIDTKLKNDWAHAVALLEIV
jgi:hypothetical protein